MKLVVISHTPHYMRDGRMVGWGPTVRELDHLASLVDSIVHVAPVYEEGAPANALTYAASNVRVSAVRPAGGESFAAKLGILLNVPAYVAAINRELAEADIVHVRCPANISLIALVLLALRRTPRRRWAKYAGSWPKQDREALSYRLQRWWLARFWQGTVVTVNGEWPNQPSHVHGLLNPCLTDAELSDAQAESTRILGDPIRLLFVGSLLNGKGVLLLPDILGAMRQLGMPISLDIVGDGPEKEALAARLHRLGLADLVTLHGWVPRPSLSRIYRNAHFLLLPSGSAHRGVWSSAEGWPKVLGEAMAYGVVPIASPVSSVPQYLKRFGAGSLVESNEAEAYARAVRSYVERPARWTRESQQGMKAASLFTYRTYVDTIGSLLAIAS